MTNSNYSLNSKKDVIEWVDAEIVRIRKRRNESVLHEERISLDGSLITLHLLRINLGFEEEKK